MRRRKPWLGISRPKDGSSSGTATAHGRTTPFRAGESIRFPYFIFTSGDWSKPGDYDRVYVAETKGKHLLGSDDTEYKKKVFSISNKEAKARSWNELGLQMKDEVLLFEVLPEDEWHAKPNEILAG